MTYYTKFYRFLLLALFLTLAGGGAFAQDNPVQDSTSSTTAVTDAQAPAGDPVATDAVAAGQGDPSQGAALWKANVCGSCHAANMKDNMTGPALGGVQARWAGEPRAHLYRWVQQSQKLIASGESARALAVWNDWKPTVMSNYTNLSDSDVEHLLAYISGVADGTLQPQGHHRGTRDRRRRGGNG